MKVLFLCRHNVARSQMAAALYNEFAGGQDAISAGIVVEYPGETLGAYQAQHPAAQFVLAVMLRQGIDLSRSQRRQVTPELVRGSDLVINMATEAETPLWVVQAVNYAHWNVTDPGAVSIERTDVIRRAIEALVRDLLATGTA